MIETSIARRYARALFELGREKGKVAEFFSDLEALNLLCHSHGDFLEVISNRFLDLKSRLASIDQIADRMGVALEVKNFAKILVRKGRVRLIDLIVTAYKRLLFDLENREEATILTARPLASGVADKIRSVLEQMTRKTIVTHTEVKPDVLGGVSVRIGGEIYDGTIRGSLDRMVKKMKEATV